MVAAIHPQDNDAPSDGGIDFLYEYVKDLPERQSHDWEAMESKAVQILTAASFIVGLASLGSVVPGGLGRAHAGLFGVGLVFYLGVLAFAGKALSIRGILLNRETEWAWENRECHPDDLKEMVVKHVVSIYPKNRTAMDRKADAITWELRLLALEALCIVTALISSRLV